MRLATALIRVLRRLAPRALQDRWTEEWLGELEHSKAGLRFAAGAIPDVVALHRLPRAAVPERHSWLNGVGQDFRHAARSLWAAPGFSATVVASLTLGIVVVACTYAFINAALFPTLPGVRDQHRLIAIYMERSTLDERTALRQAVPGVQDVASSMGRRFAIAARGQVLSVPGVFVSANHFDVLGTRIQAGRDFLDSEDRPADSAVVVLGFALSRRLFGDDNPVGASMTVGGHPVQIVGIADEDFRGTYVDFDADVDIFFAWGMAGRFAAEPANDFQRPDAAPGEYELTHIARLSDSASVEAVLGRVRLVAARLVTARIGPKYRPIVRVRSLGRDDNETAPQIAAIFAIPFLVLLIGCINAAMLLLARGIQRMRDIAVRLALGAGRWRIVRYLLAESLLLALIAAAMTLPVLSWTVAVLERFMPVPFEVDGRVAAFAVLVSCASVFGFGLAPALRLAGIRDGMALGSSRPGETPRRSQMRQLLVAVQVALSIGLLTTGAQLITGVQQLAGATGVDSPSRLLMVSFDLSQLNVPPGRAEAFYSGLLERAERLPGVERVGLGGTGAVWTDGRGKTHDNSTGVWPPDAKPERGHVWIGGYAGGDLIEAVGLRLLAGRLFTPADRTGTPRVAIINRTAATRQYNGAAVGRVIRVASRGGAYATGHDLEIVGVIDSALDPGYVPNPDDPTVEAIYLPERLRHEPALTLYVRTSEGARPMLAAIQRAASSVDPAVPIVDSATLAEHQLEQQVEVRFAAQGVTVLGIVGLALAAGGVYGMVAFLAASRRQEIGVRMALGARPQLILRLVLRQSMRTALVGAVAGGAIAVAVSVVVRAEMYGVPPVDMLGLAAAALLLGSVVLVASLIPARAAARIDPLVVLREE
jgi:putative ABC transport system permease protein